MLLSVFEDIHSYPAVFGFDYIIIIRKNLFKQGTVDKSIVCDQNSLCEIHA